MGVITIELADRIDDECSCCGGRLIRLTRFVQSDGSAHGVYFADFSPDHTSYSVRVVLSLGDWGGWDGGKVPEKRTAFALYIRATDTQYETTVIDARHTPWHDIKELGRPLTRKKALAHPWIKEVFRIADQIVESDSDVKGYLDKKGRSKPTAQKTTGPKREAQVVDRPAKPASRSPHVH
jgi:hypothetical protein